MYRCLMQEIQGDTRRLGNCVRLLHVINYAFRAVSLILIIIISTYVDYMRTVRGVNWRQRMCVTTFL